jgi:hypothetical protein
LFIFYILHFLKKRNQLSLSIPLVLLIFHYFMYHSFFNHYYLISEFIVFDIMIHYYHVKLDLYS